MRENDRKLHHRFTQEELDVWFNNSEKQLEETTTSADIDADQFNKYQPLIDEVRSDSRIALSNNFFINIRRLTMLYMAMFVLGMGWLQVLAFMGLNFLSLCYLVTVSPYTDKSVNMLNTMNEAFSLLVSYFILSINGVSIDGEMNAVIGGFIVYSVYSSWIATVATIVFFAGKEGVFKLRVRYARRGGCCKRKKPTKDDKKDKTSMISDKEKN